MNKLMIVIPSLSSGGAERVVSVLSNEWCRSAEVHIVTFRNGNSFYELDDKIILHDLGFPEPNNIFSRLIEAFKAALKLRKLYFKIEPRFVLSFITHSNVLVLLSLIFSNAKIIISERNSPSSFLDSKFSKIAMLIYKKASKIICQTNAFKEFVDKDLAIESIVIGNPLGEFIRDNEVSKDKKILCVGRLVEQKGHKLLIEAFRRVVDVYPEWQLDIVGEGPMRKELVNTISDLDLESSVFIHGATRNIQNFYERSNIFCLPSFKEGFPNALLEAMSFNCAPIAFDCETGPRELISDFHNGFLVDVGDVDFLSKRIKMLIADEVLLSKFGRNASYVNKKYEARLICQRYLDFCSK